MKPILMMLMLWAGVSWGATGDITSAFVDTSGYRLKIVVSGLNTGGTYNLGIGAKNNPTNAKIKLFVNRLGYSGVTDTVYNDTLVADTVHRKAYPNNTQYMEFAGTGICTVTVALSGFVYKPDTGLKVIILPGFYTQGGNSSNAVVNLSVTNNSNQTYTPAIANWSIVPRKRLSDSLTLKARGYHVEQRQKKPLEAIVFYATDQHNDTLKDTIFDLSIDSKEADKAKVQEFICKFPMSGFTQGDLITANFEAYPRIRATGTVLKTNDNAALTEYDWRPHPISFYCDKNNSFGLPYVVVDSAAPNNIGVASLDINTAAASPCSTLFRAIYLLRNYQYTNYSCDYPAGYVLMKKGTYYSAGGTQYHNGLNPFWLEIKNYPGVSRDSIVIVENTTAANKYIRSKYTKFSNVTLKQVTNSNVIQQIFSGSMLWFDSCVFSGNNSATTTITSTFAGQLLTHNKTTWLKSQMSGIFLRGNTFDSVYSLGFSTNICGNKFSSNGANNNGTTLLNESTVAASNGDGCIVDFNIARNLLGQFISLLVSSGDYAFGYTKGIAIVQNDIEATNTQSSGAIYIAKDGNVTHSRGVIIYNNTVAGQRCNLAYSDAGTTERPHYLWSIKNNIFNYFANKVDLFASNENCIGGWPVTFGVNTFSNISQLGAYQQEFHGLYSISGTVATPIDVKYIADSSGLISQHGGGDYHLQSTSPAIGLEQFVLLPYDLDGKQRYIGGASGAYEYGTYIAPSQGKGRINKIVRYYYHR